MTTTAEFMRNNRGLGYARAAIGHMPFPGHRTQKQVLNRERAAAHRHALKIKAAREYGFDPESLRNG